MLAVACGSCGALPLGKTRLSGPVGQGSVGLSMRFGMHFAAAMWLALPGWGAIWSDIWSNPPEQARKTLTPRCFVITACVLTILLFRWARWECLWLTLAGCRGTESSQPDFMTVAPFRANPAARSEGASAWKS